MIYQYDNEQGEAICLCNDDPSTAKKRATRVATEKGKPIFMYAISGKRLIGEPVKVYPMSRRPGYHWMRLTSDNGVVFTHRMIFVHRNTGDSIEFEYLDMDCPRQTMPVKDILFLTHIPSPEY